MRRLGDDAAHTLTTRFYAGDGRWRMCLERKCAVSNVDWAADSLTGVLYERWLLTHDPALVPLHAALARSAPRYGPCRAPACQGWSDVPMWDAVAALREYDATHDPDALGKAEAAYRSVAQSDVYAAGACPAIDYQRPHAAQQLKTLETDANRILAAVLLAQRTHEAAYLADAERLYAAVRALFLDPELALYTVYVYDDGTHCRQLPHRFFASVNGLMIEAGLELEVATKQPHYGSEARATARAVRALDDDRGIFTDLQAENDIVAPLVLAMLELARAGDAQARAWIVRNAGAAAHARRPDGTYGRFFDGPPPDGTVTAWQSNGGLALAIAAGALAPDLTVESGNPWPSATRRTVALTRLPLTLRFSGAGIALIGTLGARCCEPGRARLLLDGRELTDRTGIWQNKSSLGRPLPDSLLFAWRWPVVGEHVLQLVPDEPNAKEGGPFIDLRATLTVP